MKFQITIFLLEELVKSSEQSATRQNKLESRKNWDIDTFPEYPKFINLLQNYNDLKN